MLTTGRVVWSDIGRVLFGVMFAPSVYNESCQQIALLYGVRESTPISSYDLFRCSVVLLVTFGLISGNVILALAVNSKHCVGVLQFQVRFLHQLVPTCPWHFHPFCYSINHIIFREPSTGSPAVILPLLPISCLLARLIWFLVGIRRMRSPRQHFISVLISIYRCAVCSLRLHPITWQQDFWLQRGIPTLA